MQPLYISARKGTETGGSIRPLSGPRSNAEIRNVAEVFRGSGNSLAFLGLVTDVEGKKVVDEQQLIDRLKTRDELPLAAFYVSDTDIAEEVVQEAWLAVLQGIDRFEGRASFKTWISRIVVNLVRTRGVRENRI